MAAPAAKFFGPRDRYRELVELEEIRHDPAQEYAIGLLDDLARQVQHYVPRPAPRGPAAKALNGNKNGATQGSKSSWAKVFGQEPKKAKVAVPVQLKPSCTRGLYLWGKCGTGKTFIMDMFYETVPVASKRRVHFHEFMLDVHERLHRYSKENQLVANKANTVWNSAAVEEQMKELKNSSNKKKGDSKDDMIAKVAADMMREGWLLCFDEFQVTHISDAIIMKQLFSKMWELGAVMVATSNRPPEDLYLNGLNRPLFVPFIPMLHDYSDVHNIGSEHDYRLMTAGEEQDRRVYITPNDKEMQQLLEKKFYRVVHGEISTGVQVETQGRKIIVPKAGQFSNVAWFRFQDLCDRPLGPADYIAIAHSFHTVFVVDIPVLTLQERDQVRRLITMIDAFYDNHTKMVCTAGAPPHELFQVSEADKASMDSTDEIFAWDRTASRLIEMQSVKYLTAFVKKIDGEQFLGQYNMFALTDDDLQDMWRRYDRDDNDYIDADELQFMLEDILEKHQGHRFLSDDVLRACMTVMDPDQDGRIVKEEFNNILKDFTLVESTMRLQAASAGSQPTL